MLLTPPLLFSLLTIHLLVKMVRRATNSSSSSSISSASSLPQHNRRDLSTDLSLGLSINSASQHDNTSSNSSWEQPSDWPPIKSHRRSRLSETNEDNQSRPAFFVKVNMEGDPVGRKLNLLTLDGYEDLVQTLAHMFATTILCPDLNRLHSDHDHVLAYEDKEGDWMMVGDVPWELFLTTVKRLKITRADKC